MTDNKKCKPNTGLEVDDPDDECDSIEKIILIGRTGTTSRVAFFVICVCKTLFLFLLMAQQNILSRSAM